MHDRPMIKVPHSNMPRTGAYRNATSSVGGLPQLCCWPADCRVASSSPELFVHAIKTNQFFLKFERSFELEAATTYQ